MPDGHQAKGEEENHGCGRRGLIVVKLILFVGHGEFGWGIVTVMREVVVACRKEVGGRECENQGVESEENMDEGLEGVLIRCQVDTKAEPSNRLLPT